MYRSGIKFDAHDFESVSALLRLATKYGVEHIRRDILRGLSTGWPKTLSAWEFREADATDNDGKDDNFLRFCQSTPLGHIITDFLRPKDRRL